LVGRVRKGRVEVGDSGVLKTPQLAVPTHIDSIEVFKKILDVAGEGEEAGFLCLSINPQHLAGCWTGEGEKKRLLNVILTSAPRRWWEFWRG